MGEGKVVTTEGFSCITTQTTQNSKGVFFDIFKRRTQVAETTVAYTRRYTQVAVQKVAYLRHTGVLYRASRVRMWVSLRKVMYTSETHF